MKKVKITGKLSLNKETIAKLNEDQMNRIKGGLTETSEQVCTQFTAYAISCPMGTACKPRG